MIEWRHLVLAGLGAIESPALAQSLGGANGVEVSVVRIGAALIVCIAAATALILVLRGRSGGARSPLSFSRVIGQRGRITVIEVRRASQHADVCLIECDSTEYLLICGPGQMQLLSTRQVMQHSAQAEPESSD